MPRAKNYSVAFEQIPGTHLPTSNGAVWSVFGFLQQLACSSCIHPQASGNSTALLLFRLFFYLLFFFLALFNIIRSLGGDFK